MNQSIVLGSLAKLSDQGETMFYFGDDNNYTTPALLSMGIFVCASCGNIGSIDDPNCLKCGDRKFILMAPRTSGKVKLV